MELKSKEEKLKDTIRNNDLITVFCGGVLIINNLGQEEYRFAEPVLIKDELIHDVLRDYLEWHCDWNWIICALKICSEKCITGELKEMMEEMIVQLSELRTIKMSNWLLVNWK